MNRLPNLDPLRFFLAFLVMLFHIPQLCRNQGLPYVIDAPIFNRGTEAVYMFFVLSGFLIIRLIYRKKQRDSFSIRKFYMRRILRIFPLYYLVVTFGFIFYWIILPILEIPYENNYNLSEGIALTVFFLPNIFAKLYQPGGILEILWSLGIEEQFYLIIAPLLYIVRKHKIVLVLALLSIGYFIVFHLDVFEDLRRFKFVYFLLFAGGLVALLEERKQLEILKQQVLFPVLIVVTILVYFFTDYLRFDTLWITNLITAVLFSLFIHTIAFNHSGRIISNRVLNYFGQISYGIYMYHVIALNLVVFIMLKLQDQEIFNAEMMLVLIYIFTFAITICFAHISYKYFETYFLKLKSKFR
ncbi:acyltransferase [Psychroserpens sp.]|uniref:acyltransferase family protein n=1 Tax=Psychroserpens sp. TaxID=2020870 RepID=UPI001B2BAF9B|nr:acyltransferase [Psychroserpens sp.]MBO6607420.1 acyltransferase [Psychroserpens sp.]MBO6632369.1 acyltransferase [Psychroserpens sp.]MBO6654502.1 acyltransferase [Psychroserpens sp.]MBO6681149.1 acyltransferase [Psychroserpens sp.]MBO6749894.1 acyltransferase [Psychroserpens sp.]